MKKRSKLLKKISLIIVLILIITVSVKNITSQTSLSLSDIDDILKTEEYSYLPKSALTFIEEYYEKTGILIKTEKNKEENELYLNPDYVEYLENGEEESEYGYIPEEFTLDYSYSSSNIEVGTTNIEDISYYNLRDEGYITNIYNQGSEGLCWDFANTTSLESHIAVKSNNQTHVVFSESQIDYATTDASVSIDIGSNPFSTYKVSSLGSGGNILRYYSATTMGISPVYCEGECDSDADYNSGNTITDSNIWKYSYSYDDVLSPYEVLNTDNVSYDVDNVYNFYEISSDDEEEIETRTNIFKSLILENGAMAVTVGAYTNYSISYEPTGDEVALNGNGENVILFQRYGYSDSINHAVTIIGWDDNYTHKICISSSGSITDSTYSSSSGTYSCSSGTLYTINGAWIIQNSWGDDSDSAFIYLPYETAGSEYTSINSVSEKNYDNIYNADINGTTKTFTKYSSSEVLEKIKFYSSTNDDEVKVYLSKTGLDSDYTLVGTVDVPYAGLYTLDLSDENIILFNESFSVKLEYNNKNGYEHNEYFFNVFTSNYDDSIIIDMEEESEYDFSLTRLIEKCTLEDNLCISDTADENLDDNSVFMLSGISRNLTSSDNLDVVILDEDNNDVTSSFHIFRNFSVSNYIDMIVTYDYTTLESSNYTANIYYNNKLYDSVSVDLSYHVEGSGTEEDPYILTTPEDLNSIRYDLDGYYELGADIDLTYDTQDENGKYYNDGYGWDPIDDFVGHLDGNGHAIVGLYINRPTENYVGFFGEVGSSGETRDNLVIKNIVFDSAEINGYAYVGTLLGYAFFGTNTYSGDDDYFEISNISVINGSVDAYSFTGGLIGYMNLISRSQISEEVLPTFKLYDLFNSSEINATAKAGGIIGHLLYINNISSGIVDGNLIISSVANVGDIAVTNFYAGGIIGYNESPYYIEVNGAYNIGEITASSSYGEIYYSGSAGIGNLNDIYYYKNEVTNGNYSGTNLNLIDFTDFVTTDITSNWEYSGDWTNPVIDGITRIPIPSIAVDYFDFTPTILEDLTVLRGHLYYYQDEVYDNILKYKVEFEDESGVLYFQDSGSRFEYWAAYDSEVDSATGTMISYYDGMIDTFEVTIKDKVRIYYESNNAEGVSSTSRSYMEDDLVSIIDNTFTYTDHTFVSWNTESDGSGTTYYPGDEITITQDMTLYAQWVNTYYYVEFNANGGSGEMSTQTFTYQVEQNLSLNSYTYDGYRFVEWNTLSDGSGTSYVDGQLLKLTNDLTLYAIWELDFSFSTDYEVVDTYLYGIGDSTTVSDYLTNFDITGTYTVKIYNASNNELSDNDIIGTGSKIVIKASDYEITYTNIVLGDVNGDGYIKMNDVMKIAEYIVESSGINLDYYLRAADVNRDDSVKMNDVMKIAEYIVEGGSL